MKATRANSIDSGMTTPEQDTISRLNRRCQEAERALADARRCIDRLSRKPWCSGSLGRAFLAWDNTTLRAEIMGLRAQIDNLKAGAD